MRKGKGVWNVTASLLYKVSTCVIGIILPRLFIMGYGSEINGLQTSVTQIFSYIALLEAGVGAASLQSLFKPVAQKDYRSANEVLSATTYYYNKIGVIYFIVLAAMSLLYPLFVQVEKMTYWMVLLYILVSGAVTGINFFYKAKILLVLSAVGDGYIDSFMNLGVYIVTSIAKIICILYGVNIVLIQTVFLAVNASTTVIYFLIAKKRYPWLNFKEKPNLKAVEQKGFALVHKVTGIIFQNVDILLLTFMGNLELVSIYAMYKMVINMITSITASFADGINYVFGQSFNAGERDAYCRLIDTFNVYYSALAFSLFIVTYIMILPFLRLYTAGMDINYIFEWLPILYLIIEVLQVGREAMLRTITVAGKFKETTWQAIIETVINIVFSVGAMLVCKFIWGPETIIYGALVGTIAALLYRTLDINHYANRKILNRSSFKSNKIMATDFLIFLLVTFVFNKVTLPIHSYIEFFAWGAGLTVVVFISLIVIQSALNPKECKQAIRFIKERNKRRKPNES